MKIIEGKRLYLRELTEKYASEKYCKWLNDPVVNKYLETRKATIESLKKYIKEKKEDPNCLLFGIFLKNNNEHIGNAKLEPIDFEKKIADYGMIIGETEYWGKGLGTEITKLVVDYAFNELNLKKIRLGVITENLPAIRVYEKVGFKIVKNQEKSVRHENKIYDAIIMETIKGT